MKKIVVCLLAALVFLVFNCKKNDAFVVKGTVGGAANLQVFLDKIYFNSDSETKAKADADAAGNFKIEQKEKFQPGVYRLRFGAKKMNLIFDGSETIVELAGDLKTIDQYDFTVKGSTSTAAYQTDIRKMIVEKLKPDAVQKMVESEPNALVSAALSLSLASAGAPMIPLFQEQNKKLQAAMPASAYATQYADFVSKLQDAALKQQVEVPQAVRVGSPAPEINLPDPSGKMRSLSSLKGKVVLLDFWASWCGPCRRENPHVVSLYKKFKDRGFTVFSVSFDGVNPQDTKDLSPDEVAAAREKGRAEWKQAIAADGLVWENHVSDLNSWAAAPAAVYGVNSIPHTFLLDRKGKIVAINARENLEAEIKKLL